MFDKQRVALIGAPCEAGAAHRGAALGPDALRAAGLAASLRGLGLEVRDRGNVIGPANPPARDWQGCRHLPETVAWSAATRDAVTAALADGDFPLVLGGDHSVAIGSVAAIARHCAERGTPLSVLWLDAHADLNTPETTLSGNTHGMPAAVLCGHGHPELLALGHTRPLVAPDRFIEIGVRSVDPGERFRIRKSGLVVYDMQRVARLGMRATMARALDRLCREGGHLHVSFDVDFLDPTVAPGVGTRVAGGPNFRDALLCMEMIRDSGLMRSLDIVELNPAFDPDGGTAERMVALVESLFETDLPLARRA